ncbi:hypothetical protein B0H10DRAFT_1965031 [Mycena sp. CBHHK59/15]|nr:hypothetical protein B0H10DRAFT_1965031 [Mycena sp. CBHHK59/15]
MRKQGKARALKKIQASQADGPGDQTRIKRKMTPQSSKSDANVPGSYCSAESAVGDQHMTNDGSAAGDNVENNINADDDHFNGMPSFGDDMTIPPSDVHLGPADGPVPAASSDPSCDVRYDNPNAGDSRGDFLDGLMWATRSRHPRANAAAMASSGCFLFLECCLYPRIHFFLSRGLYSGPNCGYEELASRTVNSHAVHAGGAGGVVVVRCERDDPLGRVLFAVHPKTRKNDATCPRVDAATSDGESHGDCQYSQSGNHCPIQHGGYRTSTDGIRCANEIRP